MDATQEKTQPEQKGVLVHAIVVAAWKRMPKAGSIGVTYFPKEDEFRISATYLGKNSWHFFRRLSFLSDPDLALDSACDAIVSALGIRNNES